MSTSPSTATAATPFEGPELTFQGAPSDVERLVSGLGHLLERVAAYQAARAGHVELKFIARSVPQLHEMMAARRGGAGRRRREILSRGDPMQPEGVQLRPCRRALRRVSDTR